MMWLALGGLGLVLLLLLARAFAEAPVATVRRALVWGAGGLGLVLLGALLWSGRGAQAFWALLLFGPAIWRSWQARRAAGRFGQPGQAAPGSETTVETAMLAMTLHHESGRMTGRVKAGALAGAELADLALADLLGLLAECRAADPESVPLLEAWLDRAAPEWREAPPPPAGGPMDRAEALAVLGLAEGADAAAIRAAHRRLMQAAHPDRGGSDWLAARLNQARDTLLRG